MAARTGGSIARIARFLAVAIIASAVGVWASGLAQAVAPTIQVASTTQPMTNAPATTTNAVAACPAGSLVTGGGIDLGRADPTDPTIPSNGLKTNGSMPSDPAGNPAANGAADTAVWTAVGAFAGQSEPGDAVTGFALCAAGGLHTTVVTATASTVATQGNPANVATATCPAGTRLVGGGTFGPNVNPSFKPVASYPSDASGSASVNGAFDPTSWSAYGGAGQLVAGEVTTAFAVCATNLSSHVQVVRTDGQAPGPDGSAVTLTATCDPGTGLLSGGAAADNAGDFTNPQQGVHLRGSYPSDPAGHPVANGAAAPASWSGVVQIGGQDTTAGVHDFALCATAETAPSADVSVTATGTDPSAAGGTLIYTVTVADAGPNAATGVIVSDPLPAGVTFRSGAGCGLVGTTVSCLVGQVGRGATATATIVVTPGAAGPLSNSFSVSANETDPNPANNSAALTTNVVPASAAADLSVMNVAPHGVPSGSPLTYGVTVTNSGPVAATGVVLTDALDPLVTFNSVSSSQGSCAQASGKVTCAIGPLAGGASVPVTVTMTAPPQVNETIVTSTASVSGDQADPNPFNNTASAGTIVGFADLAVNLSDAPNPAVASGILTYTLAVTNKGPNAAHNVAYADALPAGASLLSATFVPGSGKGNCNQVPSSQTVSCVPQGSAMASGQSDVVAIEVRLGAATGVVTGSVSVSADEVDPNPANNTAAVTTTVVAQGADVSLAETIAPVRIVVTSTSFTITATIANAGTLAATNVIFRHVQPSPSTLSLASVTPSQGSCVEGVNRFVRTGFEVTCTMASLPVGGSATVSLVYKPRSATNFSGTDNVTADQPDPNLYNNSVVDAFVVLKASPTVTTTASPSVVVGGTISDTATINNGFGSPTFPPKGSLAFTLFGPTDGSCAGPAVFSSTIRLPGTVATYPGYPAPVTASSAVFTTSAPGTYRWVARYLGDGNNFPTSTACNDPGESVVVVKASPTIASQASASVPAGGTITDTATVSGGFHPTGSVTFTVYGPGDTTCSKPLESSTVALAGAMATSAPVTPLDAGTYRWIASYGGDPNNNPSHGSCGDLGETVTVTPQILTGRAYGLALSVQSPTATVNLLATPDTGPVTTTVTSTTSTPCLTASHTIYSLVQAACVSVKTGLRPSRSSALVTIDHANLHLGIPGLPDLNVMGIQASSATSCGSAVGGATFSSLLVGGVVEPVSPAPNTVIALPGPPGSELILNEQLLTAGPGADRVLTVNGLHLIVPAVGGLGADVVMASATSDIHNCP